MRPKIIIPLVIVFVCALATAGLFSLSTAQASGHGCPSDWPDASSSDGSGNGQIDFEGFHTDGDDDEWYIIRSTDSNGVTSVRAYTADDSYDAGYRSGSPAETCYLIVRRAGETEDAAQPERVQLQAEREESDRPASTPSQTPGTGGGGGTGGGTGGGGGGTGQGNALAIIAASLEVMRHSGALVAADLPTSEQEIRQYAGMVAGRETAMNAQLAILAANSQSSRVGEIRTLVNRLVSNAKAIQAGRPALLRAVAMEVRERNALTRTNQTHLLPNTEATLDEGFYNLVTDVDSVSTNDLLYYWHLDSLGSNLTLGSTFLQVASLMQDPTFVARIRETYDSIAGRMERDIAYLDDAGGPELKRDVLSYAELAYNAGSGPNNYFDRLEGRLTLVANERARVQNNDENLARLRDEIGRLAADVLDRQHPAPETTPEMVVENPGVTATEVKFGQSAALTGPSEALGTQMELGIRAAFAEANADGGVHGRTLNLLPTLDDRYEPDRAFENTQKLINEDQVFALIGAVGTPTSRAVSPLAHAEGVPFIAPFTGAQLLRDDVLTNVLNLRASYHEETTEMVDYLEHQAVNRVAVLYQNDSYGLDGLTGVEQALNGSDMELVAHWYYRRNTEAVKSAVYRIAAADPEAVIIIGASAPAAQAIQMLREKLDDDPIFMNVSFVGSDALAAGLTTLGESRDNVFFTQVVPLPGNTDDPLIVKYRAALAAVDPQAQPGFVSLEGYLAGRLAIYAVDACGQNVTRTCFLNAVQTAVTIDLDGFELMFGATDNQGSEAVFLTQIDADGQYSVVP